jgi:hypothetical protein
LYLAGRKEVIEVPMFKKLLLTFSEQLRRKLRPILLQSQLCEHIKEIDEVIERLNPSDHFPVGVGL